MKKRRNTIMKKKMMKLIKMLKMLFKLNQKQRESQKQKSSFFRHNQNLNEKFYKTNRNRLHLKLKRNKSKVPYRSLSGGLIVKGKTVFSLLVLSRDINSSRINRYSYHMGDVPISFCSYFTAFVFQITNTTLSLSELEGRLIKIKSQAI